MKILLIHNYYQYYGGEETYFESLVKLLKSKGHDVILYTKKSNNISEGLLPKIKVALEMFWNFQAEKELSQIIKEFKPVVAHFNNIYPLITPTSYRVCRKYNIPIIQMIHNYRFMCPKGTLFRKGKVCELCVNKKFPFFSIFFGCYHHSFFSSLIFSLSFSFHKLIGTFNLINKYIFPSEFTRDYYLENLNIPKEKVEVIPYFVDIKKEKTKVVEKKDYFLFVGRLSEEKGIIQLLNIFKNLPKIKIKVIGDGPLKEEVSKYRIYKNIEILGLIPHNKIKFYMENAMCMIISSIWFEVLPFVYIESLINGTPILVFSNNNFNRLLKSDKAYSEILYKFRDFDDLKNKIIKIYKKILKRKNTHIYTFTFRYKSKNHYNSLIKQYKNLSSY